MFSGYYYWGGDFLYLQDSNGYWWSTAANSDSSAYGLHMNSSYLNPQYNDSKAFGFTLRRRRVRP
ncbi:hypothetical protein IK112_01385 [Candidatus Saccharibacteria bacterium]|nr:hypothetical protein [Candidatus Saccharibacteria bacterium]